LYVVNSVMDVVFDWLRNFGHYSFGGLLGGVITYTVNMMDTFCWSL